MQNSTKYVGIRLERGLTHGIDKAKDNLSMSRSGFVRFCVMKTLAELSLLKEEVHKSGEINEPSRK